MKDDSNIPLVVLSFNGADNTQALKEIGPHWARIFRTLTIYLRLRYTAYFFVA